jgi:glycine/D-amino acid oxidase-like deaminating enzyme
VEIREREQVVDWIVRGGRLVGVRTERETFDADAVVAAVHAWTLPVLAPLQVALPVKHFVHQRYLSASLAEPMDFPSVNADLYGGYVRPAAGNRLLLGVETSEREEWRVDSTDFDMSVLQAPAGLREETIGRFAEFLPELKRATWESEKVGLISFSMDGEPVLGPVAAVPGLFLGQGFHSGGFSYNPVAGLLLAEWVSEGKTSLDISAFSPDRFAPAEARAHLAKVAAQKDAVQRRH